MVAKLSLSASDQVVDRSMVFFEKQGGLHQSRGRFNLSPFR